MLFYLVNFVKKKTFSMRSEIGMSFQNYYYPIMLEDLKSLVNTVAL